MEKRIPPTAPQGERNRCYIPAHHSHEVSDDVLLEQNDLYRYTGTIQPERRISNFVSRPWKMDLKMTTQPHHDEDNDEIITNHALITNEPLDLFCVDSILHTDRRYLTDEGMALKKSYNRTVRKLESDVVKTSVSSKSLASKDVIRSKKTLSVKKSKKEEKKKQKPKPVGDICTGSVSKETTTKESPTPKKVAKNRKKVKISGCDQRKNDITDRIDSRGIIESTQKTRRKKRKSEELYTSLSKTDKKEGKKTKKAKKEDKKKRKTKKNQNPKHGSISLEQS